MTEDFRPVQLLLSPIEEKIFDLSQAQPIYPRLSQNPVYPTCGLCQCTKIGGPVPSYSRDMCFYDSLKLISDTSEY